MVSSTDFRLAYLLLDIIHETVDFSVAKYGTHQRRDVDQGSQDLDELARCQISKDFDFLWLSNTNDTGEP